MNGASQDEIFPPDALTGLETLPADARAQIDDDEAAGKYTAARLKGKQPTLYSAAVRMLADKMSVNQVARALGLHWYTVDAVKRESAGFIDATKRDLSKRLYSTVEKGVALVDESLHFMRDRKLNPAEIIQVSTSIGILTEKAQLLAGDVTDRVGAEAPPPEFLNPEQYAEKFLKPVGREALQKNSVTVEAERVEGTNDDQH